MDGWIPFFWAAQRKPLLQESCQDLERLRSEHASLHSELKEERAERARLRHVAIEAGWTPYINLEAVILPDCFLSIEQVLQQTILNLVRGLSVPELC